MATKEEIRKHNLNVALDFALAGWKVYPSVYDAETGQHKGLVKWGDKATDDLNVINRWGKKFQGEDVYYCVHLKKSGLLVVDLDDKKGKEGTSNFNDLILENDVFYEGNIVSETPSGGTHTFFKMQDEYKTGPNKLCTGGDVPVMVPLPGSNVQGKGVYKTVAGDWCTELTETPKWIKKIVFRTKEAHDTSIELDNMDLAGNIEEAIRYLEEEAPIAIKDNGGDATTYEVACAVRDRGISEEKCIELMRNHWYERCIPAYNPDFVDKKVKNAYTYAETLPMITNPFEDFAEFLSDPDDEVSIVEIAQQAEEHRKVEKKKAEQEVVDEVNERASFHTFNDMLTGFQDLLGRPQNRFVVKNYIPEKTVSLFYGAGGSYKSFAVIDMGMKVAAGLPWCGHKTYQAPVFYLANEGYLTLGQRLAAAKMGMEEEGHEVPNELPFFSSKYSIDLFDGEVADSYTKEVTSKKKYNQFEVLKDQLITAKDLYGGSPLVIIDTYSKSLTQGHENDTKDTNRYLRKMEDLIEATGCTVILVHHTGKADRGGARGATALTNGVDFHTLVEKVEDGNDTMCVIHRPGKVKHIAAPNEIMLKMEYVELGEETDLDGEKQKIGSLYAIHAKNWKPTQEEKPKHKPTVTEAEILEIAVATHTDSLDHLRKNIMAARFVDEWSALDEPEEGEHGLWSGAIKSMLDNGYLVRLDGENIRVSAHGLRFVENNVQKE